MALTQINPALFAGSSNTTAVIQSNGTTAITVDSSQNVGIGTTAPAFKLEVVGGTNNGIHIKDAATATVFGGLFTQASAFALVARSNHALILGTNDTERMRISSAGIITTPYQPLFEATDASNTFTPGSGTYAYTTVIINRGSNYNGSSGVFTAPVAGMYYFWHQTTSRTVSSSTYEVKLYKNTTTEVARVFSNGAGYGPNATAVSFVSLAAGDTMIAGFYNGPGVVMSGQGDIGTSIGMVSGWGGMLIG